MGDVLASLRILPDSPETDIAKVTEEIKHALANLCTINKTLEEEIGFGLKALIIEVIVPDEEGKLSVIEEKLAGIEGISQVDTQNVSLI